MDRAPGSNASSLYPHLLLERVLEPWAVVEVGTAKQLHQPRNALHFPPQTAHSGAGAGAGAEAMLSS